MSEPILRSTIRCPQCGHCEEETMPIDACHFFYECGGCAVLLRPAAGDCCVFCPYGTVPCPSKQLAGSNGGCCPGESQAL